MTPTSTAPLSQLHSRGHDLAHAPPSKLATVEDNAIRDVVLRLSRPLTQGGHSVEHAIIVAEGSDWTAIVAWILAHGGTPEAAPAARARRGLHGPRESMRASPSSVPQRYILPPNALT